MPDPTNDPTRTLLRHVFDAAVAAAHPATCLPPHLPSVPAGLRIVVVGAGKAAAAMALAAEQVYRASNGEPGGLDCVTGALVTRHGYGLATTHLALREAGHPVPDVASVAAAEEALALAASAGPGDLVLVLLSGGASALWSAPVAGVGLADKQALTRALLKAGARISEINAVRRHLSRIKGGKLAAAAAPARVLTLAISDVPGDDPATIGSGPTVADATTLADARAVLTRYAIAPPPAIAAALADAANETLKPSSAALQHADYRLIATPALSLAAGATVLRAAGYDVEILGDSLEGEARDVGAAHAALARQALAEGRRVAILSGGELTVTVRGAGRGGPNQEYALGLAAALDGAPGISALAADSDGTDGGGGDADDPAGAFVLPDTLARARARGLDCARFLADNDSTRFFRALGDLLETGPTQTNVNDIRAILVDPRP